MAHATTPHTETQQNRKLDRTDLEPDQLEQTSGTGEDAELYRNNEGAQTGTDRAPEKFPDAASNLNTEQAVAAYEGSVTTRTPPGSGQGITSRSADEENVGQERVVRNRPDAQAGVNHSR
jgi:hypothetical protein